MNIFTSIFLGIVQGLSEFLPISSSGHLTIFQQLFKLNYTEDENLLFEVLLHLGTLMAVFLVYRKDVIPMVKETWQLVTGKGSGGKTEDGRITNNVRLTILVGVATLPLVVLVPFSGLIERLYTNLSFVALALLVTGAILYAADRIPKGKKDSRSITVKDVLLVGLAQGVALLPGVSRSGSTISAGIACGLKRSFATKFAFLLSIPAVLGSFVLQLIKALIAGVNWSLLPVYLVGTVFAGVV
ncbi:MAG: undecaprenyl-diphosphate phosphatase, partial [Oscillospiraceae bacterium]|nr:undecaprenyl-diphosphate phosphatase [Oscillospiraceae bacterium]